jgi:hypothetical protein
LPPLDAKGIKHVQQIAGSILYYAWAVNMTVLMALSSITIEQTVATTRTMGRCIELLDYIATTSHAQDCFDTSDMIMNIHSDASYLSETKAHSCACRHFFHGLDAAKWRTHKIERRIIYQHDDFYNLLLLWQ